MHGWNVYDGLGCILLCWLLYLFAFSRLTRCACHRADYSCLYVVFTQLEFVFNKIAVFGFTINLKSDEAAKVRSFMMCFYVRIGQEKL